MRGWYAHVSQQMRDELLVALQIRWEDYLCHRAEIDPYSPVPQVDDLLAPIPQRHRSGHRPPEPPAPSPDRMRWDDLPNFSQHEESPIHGVA